MSKNKSRRIISLFVGILLFAALMQTACAAWDPNWNSNTGDATAWNPMYLGSNPGNVLGLNPADWNANTGTVTTKSGNTKDRSIRETVWGSGDDSFSPSDFMTGLISQNGILIPPI